MCFRDQGKSLQIVSDDTTKYLVKMIEGFTETLMICKYFTTLALYLSPKSQHISLTSGNNMLRFFC